MNVIRGIVLFVLFLLAGGFGLCALSSLLIVVAKPAFLVLTGTMVALTWLCVKGIQHLTSGDAKTDEKKAAASEDD
jgi:hypothetical protein